MALGKLGRRGGFGSGGALGGARVYRTLDLAGPELVLNGGFTTDLSNWTDASSAGGAVAWNSSNGGVARLTNTSGTARLRQNPAVTSGKRYVFFARNIATSGVAASLALGSTTPGSTDLLNYASTPSLAARAGVAQFTAPTSVVNISLVQSVAGNNDWKNPSLRPLNPTQSPVGTVFSQDFALTPDGELTVTPDSLPWLNMTPANADHVYPFVSSGRMAINASGGTKSASYTYLHLGTGKVAGMLCDLAWTSSGPSCAMVSLTPTGTIPTVTNITTNSLHPVFTDTKVDVSTYVGGVLHTDTVNYPTPCVTDGRNYPNTGWSLNGDTITLFLPDGTTSQITDSRYSQVRGNVAIPEIFYGSGVSPGLTIGKISVTLG